METKSEQQPAGAASGRLAFGGGGEFARPLDTGNLGGSKEFPPSRRGAGRMPLSERDLPQLGVTIPSNRLRQFWSMLAHYHGQTWNAADVASSLGVSQPGSFRFAAATRTPSNRCSESQAPRQIDPDGP